MIHYNVWFSLKPGVSEEEVLGFVRAFIEELSAQGNLSRGIILKNTGEPPKKQTAPLPGGF